MIQTITKKTCDLCEKEIPENPFQRTGCLYVIQRSTQISFFLPKKGIETKGVFDLCEDCDKKLGDWIMDHMTTNAKKQLRIEKRKVDDNE